MVCKKKNDQTLSYLFNISYVIKTNFIFGFRWLPLCDRNDSTWDTLFCKVLYNAVHYGWAKGIPLFDACIPIRRFLFQLLTTSICYPVVSKRTISFSKSPVNINSCKIYTEQYISS
jgi:hypothetical protein